MSVLKILERGFDLLVDICGIAATVLLAILVIVVNFEVGMRYFFNFPILWVIEPVEFALVFITFLSAPWILRYGGHVSLDVVTASLNERTQGYFYITTSIVAACVCVLICIYGIIVTWDYFKIDFLYPGDMRVHAWLLQPVIPASAFLMSIQFIRNAYHRMKTLNKTSTKKHGSN